MAFLRHRDAYCHCLECQRRTGSTFGAQAKFRSADVEVTGPSTAFRRIADSGNAITSRFCPDCGSTVYCLPADEADVVVVTIGAFADPCFARPRAILANSGMIFHDYMDD